MRWLGIGSIGALLAALVASLGAILPRPMTPSAERPNQEAQAFNELLGRKTRWLTWTVIFFGAGVVLLGAVLIIALSLATQ